GGTTVGEALNILENTNLGKLSSTDYLHYFLESSRVAFADRNRWVGDPDQIDVPTKQLLSQRFADSRACLISPVKTLTSPVPPGDPRNPTACATTGPGVTAQQEGTNTSHLTTADAW